MLSYIVLEMHIATGRILRIVEVYDNYESALAYVDSWKKHFKKDDPYKFEIIEKEVKSNV
jgi:hypothetical protein